MAKLKDCKTVQECEQAIRMIECNYRNYIGGLRAFQSGNRTELTVQAKLRIVALNKRIAEIADNCEDD